MMVLEWSHRVLWWRKCNGKNVGTSDSFVSGLSSSVAKRRINIKRKKLQSFVACKIWYSEIEIFFNSYVYYLTHGFFASTRAFSLQACKLELVICEFELGTCGFLLVTHGVKLVTRKSELVTRISCFNFLPITVYTCYKCKNMVPPDTRTPEF